MRQLQTVSAASDEYVDVHGMVKLAVSGTSGGTDAEMNAEVVFGS
jgi:hypothetical protein